MQQQNEEQAQQEQQAQADVRQGLDAELFSLSQLLWEMEICAGDVQCGRETATADYITQIAESYASVLRLSSISTDDVPLDVLELVDQGKNPHIHTKRQIETLVTSAQEMSGRFLGVEVYRSALTQSLVESFPGLNPLAL